MYLVKINLIEIAQKRERSGAVCCVDDQIWTRISGHMESGTKVQVSYPLHYSKSSNFRFWGRLWRSW